MPPDSSKNYNAKVRRSSCTCGSLRRASRRVSQFYDAALAPTGIKSTQYSILAELDRDHGGGGITMRELASAMVMDRSTLGHNLRPLQREKLLALRLSTHDRRRRYVELTRKGRAKLQFARRLWRAAEGRFGRIFGRRHAADLRAILHQIASSEKLNSLPLD